MNVNQIPYYSHAVVVTFVPFAHEKLMQGDIVTLIAYTECFNILLYSHRLQELIEVPNKFSWIRMREENK